MPVVLLGIKADNQAGPAIRQLAGELDGLSAAIDRVSQAGRTQLGVLAQIEALIRATTVAGDSLAMSLTQLGLGFDA